MRRSALVRAALLTSLLSLPAFASDDVDARKGGSLWARIEKGGVIRIEGVIVGEIGEDGSVRVGGRIAGRVEDDGGIRDDGTIVGRVEQDGTLLQDGTVIGRIEEGGALRRHGSIWGEASPCRASFRETRRLAALLYFFDGGFFGR